MEQDKANEAFERLNIQGKKDRDTIRIATAGFKERNDPHEIIAYSFSKNYTGKGSSFNQEIERIILERIGRK